jgi:hypothetical protein
MTLSMLQGAANVRAEFEAAAAIAAPVDLALTARGLHYGSGSGSGSDGDDGSSGGGRDSGPPAMPHGLDIGQSVVSTLAGLESTARPDSFGGLGGGYDERSATPGRPLSRPNSRTVRPHYKVQMQRRRNDTYLRRFNHVASAFVMRRDEEEEAEVAEADAHRGGDFDADAPDSEFGSVAEHGSFAAPAHAHAHALAHQRAAFTAASAAAPPPLNVQLPSRAAKMSFYFLLYGGTTDVHMRSQAQRLVRRVPGPLDDPLVGQQVAVGLTLELLTAAELRERVSAPATVNHDGYGGEIVRARHHDPGTGKWSHEVVRRTFVDDFGSHSFEGECDAGVRSGHGTMRWQAGGGGPCLSYDGQWQADVPHGRGRMEFADGSTYEGEWRQGRQEGRGRGTWAVAARDGAPDEWFAPHGRVALDESFQLASYEGDWVANLPHGHGAARFSNGALFSGSFAFGHVQGPGELTVQSAADGGAAASGAGTARHPHHPRSAGGRLSLVAVGNWREGALHDAAALWKLDSALGGPVETYNGPFVRGLREGEGATAELADGSHYEGPYRSGRRNGIGQCRYANKDIFRGKFVHDKRSGKGSLLRANGDVLVGCFEGDALSGPGLLRRAATLTETHGVWRNGVLTTETGRAVV